MEKVSWDYLDPVDYDDADRLKQLHTAAMMYSGIEQALPSQVVIVSHTAKFRDMESGKYYPLSLDILKLNVAYLNDPRGVWHIDRAPDTNTNHVRQNVYDITHLDVPDVVNVQRAKYGAISMLDYDPYTAYYPAFKNVNPDVAMAPMYLSFVAAAAVHIAYDDWKQQVGSSRTDEQYVAKTINHVNVQISKRFDPRFTYNVTSYVTPADKKRRYSWTTELTVGIPNTKWVNQLKIISDNF